MKHDFDVITHRFPGAISIYPISDVHLGAAEHMSEAWDAFCRSVLKRPDTYLILNGDLINNATRSSVSNIFEETCRPSAQKRIMADMLAPLRDRILCITSGNHERRSLKDADADPSFDIACKLDLEDLYRPNIAFMQIGLGEDGRRDGSERVRKSYTFAVTHGAGGGIYTGASVNRAERFGNVVDGLDCLIVGHAHKGFVTKPEKLIFDSNRKKIYPSHYTVIEAVSWLAYAGYAVQKMLLPAFAGDPQRIDLASGSYKKITTLW